jgi:hypothetical protein
LRRVVLLVIVIFSLLSLNFIHAQQAECPGSRLSIGDFGKVPSADVTLRVRDAAGTGGKVIGQVTQGIFFQILDGPICQDGYNWWKIQTDTVEGWAAEGDSEGYFIEPLQNVTPSTTPNLLPTATLPPVTGNNTDSNADRFAAYTPGTLDSAGTLQPYIIAPDFNNILLTMPLSKEQLDVMRRNGFAITPSNSFEFYSIYKRARDNYQPQFITTDSMLHSTTLALRKVIRSTESKFLVPLLRELTRSLLIETDKIYQSLLGTAWENSARRNVAYAGVGARLLDPNAPIPGYAAALVDNEIANIQSGGGSTASAIFPDIAEDWALEVPRGHYATNDDLSGYFQVMTYYGQTLLHLEHAEETQSALLLIVALRNANVAGRPGKDAWSDLYDVAGFFSGQSGSWTVSHYLVVLDQVYGAKADAKAIQSKGIDPFVSAAHSLPLPRTLDNAPLGFRLLAQPIDWDTYIFSQLTTDKVGSKDRIRALPSALDFFAVLGWDRAFQILDKQPITSLENYKNQMSLLRSKTASLGEAEWTKTLYGSWLYTLNTLKEPVPAGYPSFMGNQTYADRNLFAALSSFVELEHSNVSNIVEAASIGTAISPVSAKGLAPLPPLPFNYVEPVPVFWARLAALTEMTRIGLAGRQMLDTDSSVLLKTVGDLNRRFQAYSIKELKNEPLTPQEHALLADYYLDLEKIILASSDQPGDTAENIFKRTAQQSLLIDEPQAALIAGVYISNDDKKILEIGTGSLFDLYVAVPINGRLYSTHGAVFSYHEFEQPLNAVLTDANWHERLISGRGVIPIPGWTFSFMALDIADPLLGTAIRNYQQTLVDSLWYTPRTAYENLRSEVSPVSQFIASQLEPLANSRQYEGRYLIETHFADFVRDHPESATITTRETWRGTLHNIPTDDAINGPQIAERGPYTIKVIYRVIRDENGIWHVTDISVEGAPPNWTATN